MLKAMIVAALVLLLAAPTASSSPSLERDQVIAKRVICKVFGPYCAQALRVSWCESRYWVWAKNGQYHGLFQMGSSERRMFGHSYNNAWVQARAAHRYFVASGRDWSPWSCKP